MTAKPDPSDDLDRLGEQLRERLLPAETQTLTHPAEVDSLASLSEEELRDFCERHDLIVVRRLGGSQIEVTPGRAEDDRRGPDTK